jgi:hypothetical protein
MELIIDCVWCLNRKDFVKFNKSTTGEYSYVIDYYAIMTKLSKSDVRGEEPGDSVIGLHIMKSFNNSLNKFKELHENEEDVTEMKILYLLKNLDQETITAIQKFITASHGAEYGFNLIVLNREDLPKRKVLTSFSNVRFIDI